MTYHISLKLKSETHQHFAHIHQQLNAGETQNLAKPLGEVLADISCEVIDQVFGDLARLSTSGDGESEKVIQQIVDTMRKYMPWSVSFFSNDRLTPMVNYLEQMISVTEGSPFLSYSVEKTLVTALLGCVEQMNKNNKRNVAPALKVFTKIVDQGVTSLIR